ncbi:hypothetical protein DPMN_073918 [Dreissena polymorpha]|uniref:Uncharacterized protein n=1 Tax=Dreissena polymorpha TaxID=45954 RepID=A0A9D4BMT8_DREPO|nr:hypothetical protein DPMN_073918 [Dreissena polymorpha]
MAFLDATSHRPKPQNGFPSTLSVLGIAVLRQFHYQHRTTPRNPGQNLCPMSATPVLYAATSAAPVLLSAM